MTKFVKSQTKPRKIIHHYHQHGTQDAHHFDYDAPPGTRLLPARSCLASLEGDGWCLVVAISVNLDCSAMIPMLL